MTNTNNTTTQPCRAYRIKWAWKIGKRTFTATTLWLFPGDRDGALKNFLQRRKEAICARVAEELA